MNSPSRNEPAIDTSVVYKNPDKIAHIKKGINFPKPKDILTAISKNLGVLLIVIFSIIPIFLWYPSVRGQFSFRSVGQILALVGSVLFSINFILSGRFKFLDRLFNGLNRAYIIHHLTGEIALILLLFHPMFISFFYLRISFQSAFDVLFPPLSEYATWFGMAAILLLVLLLVLTLYIKLPYDIWKLTHKFLGISLFLASLHIFFISSSVTTNLPLRFYILGFCILGIFSYIYRTLLGRFFIQRYKYKIAEVKIMGNVTEVSMQPIKKKMNYLPGQFVFIKFNSLGVTREEHPFSLTSDPKDNIINICAKSVGNYTETMKLLKKDSGALIEGPFGSFSYLSKNRKKQIWVAGGIGITPFISMAKSFTPYNQYDVFLYYVVGTPEEAVYLDDLIEISKLSPNLKVIKVFTKSEGRLNAEKIEKQIKDIKERDILVCGPTPMMKSLREQLNGIGIKNYHIFSEEFSIDS